MASTNLSIKKAIHKLSLVQGKTDLHITVTEEAKIPVLS
jgi:hypothetical protein